jgi:hypothetical protein
MQSKLSRARARISGRYALATAAVILVGLPAGALASGEGRALLGGTRSPSSGSYTRETEVIANTSTYGTRQSNKRLGDGGGAIYGCRSDAGREPCVRGVNLRTGQAFAYDTKHGKVGGSITIGDATGVPFTTNATGTVTNLSADKVDGKDSTDFAAAGDVLSAAVNADGSLVAGARGATAAARTDAASQTYTVTFGRDVSRCSYTASPVGASSDFALGVGSGATSDPATTRPNNVIVDQRDATSPAGDNAGRAFHLQVIC